MISRGSIPDKAEAFICRELGKEPGYFLAGVENPAPQGTGVEARILENIVQRLNELMAAVSECNVTVDRIAKKVHANTVQLEKIKEKVERKEDERL